MLFQTIIFWQLLLLNSVGLQPYAPDEEIYNATAQNN